MSFLLIDFGASRIKSAIYKDIQIVNLQNYASVTPLNTDNKHFVISAKLLKDFFLELITESYKEEPFEGILISSEMHGFIVTDKNNTPISDYISWKDERCLNPENIEEFKVLKEKLTSTFLQKTGMNFRSCYPITKLLPILKKENLKEAKILSLPEWLCCCNNDSLNLAHITMSAGLGFYNVKNNSWDSELISLFREYHLVFNDVTSSVEVGGYVHIDNKKIPIYTGIGDLQAAILGAGYSSTTVNINLGTGSQVVLYDSEASNTEFRPFVDKKLLSVITHIPSGRALNVFINFLSSINPNINYWEYLNKIGLEELDTSSLKFELGVFNSAWNYNNGGNIGNIFENNFDIKNYLSSLLKSYLYQYEQAIQELCGDKTFDTIILSGGIATKLKIIHEYFKNKYKNCKVTTVNTAYDETLAGLSKIADQIKKGKECQKLSYQTI